MFNVAILRGGIGNQLYIYSNRNHNISDCYFLYYPKQLHGYSTEENLTSLVSNMRLLGWSPLDKNKKFIQIQNLICRLLAFSAICKLLSVVGIKIHFDYYQNNNNFQSINAVIQKIENHKIEGLNTNNIYNSLGVHLRRGDYLNAINSSIYFLPTIDWYINEIIRMKSMNEKLKKIYVFTNDVEWAENYFEPKLRRKFEEYNLELPILIENKTPSLDLIKLSCCEYIVGSASTFSYWAIMIGMIRKSLKNYSIPNKYYNKDNKLPPDLILK